MALAETGSGFRQEIFPWLDAIDVQKDESQITDFYEPKLLYGAQDKIFPHGMRVTSSQEIEDKLYYYPYWMTDVYGSYIPTYLVGDQMKKEDNYAVSRNLLYSDDAIRTALHINRRALGTRPQSRNGWYDCKTCTHPMFFLNFLRFSLRNGLFSSLEDATSFLDEGQQPIIKVKDALLENDKLRLTPEDLPKDVPLALIHGRFLGIPHLDQEKAIRVLHGLKKTNPDIKVVVAVDPYATEVRVGNNTFRMSLLAKMNEVDYVTLVDIPISLLDEPDASSGISAIDQLTEEERDAFYADYYQRIFSGRNEKYLYVNPYYPQSFKEKLLNRCEELEIEPIGRGGGVVWSNTILYGYGGLPDSIINPFDGKEIYVGAKKDRHSFLGDPEEIVLSYWEWLALHVASEYLQDKTKVNDYAAHYLFGSPV